MESLWRREWTTLKRSLGERAAKLSRTFLSKAKTFLGVTWVQFYLGIPRFFLIFPQTSSECFECLQIHRCLDEKKMQEQISQILLGLLSLVKKSHKYS